MMEKAELANYVEKARSGDPEAWETLIKETGGQIRFTIRKYIKDVHAAEDVEQDAFIKIYTHIGSLKKTESFKSWSCEIAATTSLMYLRNANHKLVHEMASEQFGEEIDFEDENIEFQPEESLDQAEIASLINQMLDKLPQTQQIALALHYGDLFPASKIAELLGCSVNTAKGYLKYGVANLRKQKDEMEKKGIKLRTVAIAPLLRMLFTSQAEELRYSSADISRIASKTASHAAESMDAVGKTSSKSAKIPASGSQAAVSAAGTASTVAASATAAAKLTISKLLIGAVLIAGAGGASAYAYHSHIANTAAVETFANDNFTTDQDTSGPTDTTEGQGTNSTEESQVQSDLDSIINTVTEQGTLLADADLANEENRKAIEDFLSSDAVKEYRAQTGSEIVWIPSDTGENVTGFYPNGGIYQGTAESGIRTGNGVWRYKSITFNGIWANDLPNGEGVLICSIIMDGQSGTESYSGNFIDGNADGIIHREGNLGRTFDFEANHGLPISAPLPEGVKQRPGKVCIYYIREGNNIYTKWVNEDTIYRPGGLD